DDSAGNGNGLADPGETVRVPLTLRNDGTAAALAVGATLISGRPDLGVFTVPGAAFADLAPGGTATSLAPHAELRVAADAVCGEVIPVTVAAAAADSAATAAFSVVVGGPVLRTRTFAAPPGPVAIPDADPTGTAVAVMVSETEALVAI